MKLSTKIGLDVLSKYKLCVMFNATHATISCLYSTSFWGDDVQRCCGLAHFRICEQRLSVYCIGITKYRMASRLFKVSFNP
ncbi:hypothetical protein BS50DRAFT_579192 [Corynespora cassiicola Philippines]|uniref:Uncharacterized protein n=1 Tax=Corynespora cassiicola Philippines TaxID=1448308 RepID=A0A2T2N5F2_CORCC|nr:hypothetical protein BS50DRAFT_579192 [Corynespora cassiicola Philippines]